MKAQLRWNEQDARTVSSVAELDSVLDELTELGEPQPLVVELIAENGASLAIGVGGPSSTASFVSGNQNPPYLQSLGASGDDDPAGVFFYYGEWTEFPRRNLIPNAKARQAMREFLETGDVPAVIRWEEV